MKQPEGFSRLEHVAPPYLELWEQDKARPQLYHYEGETLTRDELKRRSATRPGLTVVRLENA